MVNLPPNLVLGTVQWGMPYGIANSNGQPSAEQVKQILSYARSAGINTLDTARAYGESEAVIGACADSHWRVVTKLSPNLSSPTSSPVELAKKSLAESRAALGRDKLDLLMLHRAEHRSMWEGKVWDMLLEERRQGGISKLGVSAGSPEEAWSALEDPDVEAIQVASSLFDQRLHRAGFFVKSTQRSGFEVFVRSVFLQGVAFLDPEKLPLFLESLREPLIELRKLCLDHQISIAAACIQFALHRFPAQLVLGAESIEQVQEFVGEKPEPKTIEALEKFGNELPNLASEILNPALWPEVVK